MPERDTGHSNPSPADLQQLLDRLQSLDADPEQIESDLVTIRAIVRPELERDYTTVAEYTGKEARSIEICETGVSHLADLAETHPEETCASVDLLTEALTFQASATVREDAASALTRIAETHPTAVVKVLPPIIQALEDPSWEVRHHALAVIGEVPTVAVERTGLITRLDECLTDTMWLVRAEAARTLWSMAKIDAESVAPTLPTLITRLGDEEPEVRRVAGSALAQAAVADLDQVIDTIDEMARQHDDPLARAGAARAIHGLCTHYPEESKPLTGTVVECLFDSNGEVRTAAVESLETMARQYPARRETLIDRLLAVLDDPEWTVAYGAADALAILAQTVPERADELVAALLETLTRDSTLTRVWCGKAIVTLVDTVPETRATVETELVDRLMTASLDVKKSVGSTVEELASEVPDSAVRIRDTLLERMQTGAPQERADAAAGLATLAFTDPTLLDGCDSHQFEAPFTDHSASPTGTPHTDIKRMTAITILFALEDDVFAPSPSVVQTVINTLVSIEQTADQELRQFGFRALCQPTTVEQSSDPGMLIDAFEGALADPDDYVRARAAVGCATVADHHPDRVVSSPESLLEATTDPYLHCQLGAIEAIGTVATHVPATVNQCLPSLAPRLSDDDWQIRAEAAKQLHAIAEVAPAAVAAHGDHLLAALSDPETTTQERAANAIATLLQSGIHPPVPDSARERLATLSANPGEVMVIRTVSVELLLRVPSHSVVNMDM